MFAGQPKFYPITRAIISLWPIVINAPQGCLFLKTTDKIYAHFNLNRNITKRFQPADVEQEFIALGYRDRIENEAAIDLREQFV